MTFMHGQFCWADLATSDAEAAKSFYGALMHWTMRDDPTPGGGVYTVLQLEDGNVGALYGMMPEMIEAGVHPHWMTYVAVDDAEAVVARVEGLGGTVIREVMTIPGAGAMATLQDPTGAVFSVWQAAEHAGCDFTDGRPGTACWFELVTRDGRAAAAFYAALFGWEARAKETGGHPYTHFWKGETEIGGMLEMTDQWGDAPPHWMLYFAVNDCATRVAAAAELGGEVCIPPTAIPGVGTFAVITDPQRAAFSVIELTT